MGFSTFRDIANYLKETDPDKREQKEMTPEQKEKWLQYVRTVYRKQNRMEPEAEARAWIEHLQGEVEADGRVWDTGTEMLYRCIVACCFRENSIAVMADGRTIGIDTNKGLLVTGVTGIGKTLAFKHCRRKPFFGGRIFKCKEIGAEVEEDGRQALKKRNPKADAVYDDLGLEGDNGEVWHYKNRVKPLEDIIYKRIEAFEDFGHRTYITTNLTEDQLKEVYDGRVMRRLMDMCELVEMPQTEPY